MSNQPELELMLSGYGSTTMQVHYWMPDFPNILQLLLWQFYDLEPDFPRMHKFLDFWDAEIEAQIKSVEYQHVRLIGPSEWRKVDGTITIN